MALTGVNAEMHDLLFVGNCVLAILYIAIFFEMSELDEVVLTEVAA